MINNNKSMKEMLKNCEVDISSIGQIANPIHIIIGENNVCAPKEKTVTNIIFSLFDYTNIIISDCKY